MPERFEDQENPCLCIANGLPPAAHKHGERCPSWDMLLYGNAYGHIVSRTRDGYAEKIEWLDPQDVIIRRTNDMSEQEQQELRSKYDTRTRRLVRHMLAPGTTFWCVIFAFIGVAVFYRHLNSGNFWIMFGAAYAGRFLYFWLQETYHWAGGKD